MSTNMRPYGFVCILLCYAYSRHHCLLVIRLLASTHDDILFVLNQRRCSTELQKAEDHAVSPKHAGA